MLAWLTMLAGCGGDGADPGFPANGQEGGIDVAADTAYDTGVDATTDTASDSAFDTGADTGVDAPTEAATDADTDADLDVAVDADGSEADCAAGDFRCDGDVLQTCAQDGSGYLDVLTCAQGLCDALGKQCDNCLAGGTGCVSSTQIGNCSVDGQTLTPIDCPPETPHCGGNDGVATCRECLQATDCPATADECTLPVCSADGLCGTTAEAAGTACGTAGAGGTCDGAGTCRFCATGDARCIGVVPEACDTKGQWLEGTPCSGGEPICLAGVCVQCLEADDCPTSTNECAVASCDDGHACEYVPKSEGVFCAGGLGKCDGDGQCNLCTPGSAVCNGNVPLLCGSDGQYAQQPACGGDTPACDPETGTCVQCLTSSHCPLGAQSCLDPVCSNKTCGFVAKAEGTSCPGGTCSAIGTCQACIPGTVTCDGNGILTCNSSGQYDPVEDCISPEPYCDPGTTTCVECVTSDHCPTPTNECLASACSGLACVQVPKVADTPCSAGAGKCDGAGQCNLCTPGTAICNGNIPVVCGSDGHYAAQPACAGDTPVCNPNTGTCVQCVTTDHCPAGTNPCVDPICSNHTCGYTPKTEGSSCPGGTCSALGTCQVCVPGTVVCDGNGVLTCNGSGQYDPIVNCVSPNPYCEPSSTNCVECIDAADCPAAANECLTRECETFACSYAPVPADTPCNEDAGKCDGAGQCNVCTPGTAVCNGNVPLLCGSNGQYAPQTACEGDTPVCDPFTGSCVECAIASQCPASANPCLDAVCASNICGFAVKPEGSACPDGTCSTSGMCQACTPDTVVCEGNGVLTCNSIGQYDPIENCVSPAPYCDPVYASCVQCLEAAHCVQPTNPCLLAACSGGACGVDTRADGTACNVGTDAGTCAAGNCHVCEPGETRCKPGALHTLQTCLSTGQWDTGTACAAPTPMCTNGACFSGPLFAMRATSPTARISVNNTGFARGSGAWTFEFWVRIHDLFVSEGGIADPSEGRLFDMNENYAAYAIRPRVFPGRALTAYTYNNTTGPHNIIIPAPPLAADDTSWHHFAMTYDGAGTGRLFIDGGLAGKQTGAAPDIQATSPMAIGKAAGYAPYMASPVSLGGIRYSKVDRYPGDTSFAPAASWSVDGNTIAQYLTFQGLGPTLVDEAGGDNVGTVYEGWEPETP